MHPLSHARVEVQVIHYSCGHLFLYLGIASEAAPLKVKKPKAKPSGKEPPAAAAVPPTDKPAGMRTCANADLLISDSIRVKCAEVCVCVCVCVFACQCVFLSLLSHPRAQYRVCCRQRQALHNTTCHTVSAHVCAVIMLEKLASSDCF